MNLIADFLGTSVAFILSGSKDNNSIEIGYTARNVLKNKNKREYLELLDKVNDENMEDLANYTEYLISKQKKD